jgi:transposase
LSSPVERCPEVAVVNKGPEVASSPWHPTTAEGPGEAKRALIEAARAAARTKGTYFSAQYSRIARRRGPNKAAIAVAHSILNVTWHLLTTGALYDDPGADYFLLRHDPAVEAKWLQERIEALGFEVTIGAAAA